MPAQQTRSNKLLHLVQEAYEEEPKHFTPMHPWILVRVLPKAQESHGFWLPDSQNKVLHEGFVLTTWKPYDKKVNGLWKEINSKLHVSDRVIFPHYVGMPVSFLDEKLYRVVKEEDILGTLNDPQDKRIKEVLKTLFDGAEHLTISGV